MAEISREEWLRRRGQSAIASTPGAMRAPTGRSSGLIVGNQNAPGYPPPPTQSVMAVFGPDGSAKQVLVDPTAGVMAYNPRPRGTEVEQQLEALWDLAHVGETADVRQNAVRQFNALYAATEGATEPAGMGASYGQALDVLKKMEANIEDYGAYAPDVEAEIARQRGNLRAGALAETLNLPKVTAEALLAKAQVPAPGLKRGGSAQGGQWIPTLEADRAAIASQTAANAAINPGTPGGPRKAGAPAAGLSAADELLARTVKEKVAQAMVEAGMGPDPAELRGKTLLEAIGMGGEIRRDPVMAAARAMNARQIGASGADAGLEGNYAGGFDSGELLNADQFNPAERPINASELSIEELAALLPASAAAGRQPYAVRQMSEAETRQAFEDSGASKTSGGRRNANAKNSQTPETAQLYFSPGGVIAQDLQPDLSAVEVPILVAPKNQERRDQPGNYQIRNVFLNEPGAQRAMPRQSSADMRVLKINPLGELPEDIAKALDLYASAQLDKGDTGSYDSRAANVPIPDPREVGGGGGFEPKRDLAAPAAPQRPMTVAEALKAIASRNSAPIRTVRLSDLVGGGVQIDERGNEVGLLADQLMATDPTRRSLVRGIPLSAPVDVYPLRPGTDLLSASKVNADNERVVDVRLGSKGRYQPSIYGELDALVGALARQQYGGEPNVDWGMAMNTARPDPVMDAYQRKLLGDAGFDVAEGRNPLLAMVDQLGALQSVPVGDVAIAPATKFDPKTLPADSPVLANALRRAKLAAYATPGGAAAQELAARQVLSEAVNADPIRQATANQAINNKPAPQSLTDPAGGAVNIPGQRFVQRPLPGMEGELLNPQPAIDPITRDVAAYMAARAPQPQITRQQPVVQYVPQELYDQFFRSAQQAAVPQGNLQRSAARRIMGR